jgi:hypothetical protein
MRIKVLLPARSLAWHERLVETLACGHDVMLAEGEADLVLDLGERGSARGVRLLRPLYDGSPDPAALRGRLQRHECPYLELVDETGATRAASYAAIEDKGDLGRGLDQAFARVEALLLRACAGQASPIPPRPERPPARYSRLKAVKAAARRLAGRMLAPLRGRGVRHGHWNIALRRHDGAPDLAGFDLSDWRPLPTDPDVYFADPFVFEDAGRSWLFAEAYPYSTGKGFIVCAEVTADGQAGAFRTAIEQPRHLSYPFVFRADGDIWMMPESVAEGGIELHRATAFPDQWAFERRLFADKRVVDPTLFEHDGLLWLFAGEGWDELFAWHAPGLDGPWVPHACNPIKSDCRSARPGGRPIRVGDRLLRPAQRCERRYGESLVWLEIEKLTPDAFAEKEVAAWRAGGLCGPHNADLAGPVQAIDYRLEPISRK